MGPAQSVPLSELAIITEYWEHSSEVHFKTLFPNHTDIKYIKMSNCEEDASLLKFDTVEDCLRFLVVKLIILSTLSDTWDLGVGVRNYFS